MSRFAGMGRKKTPSGKGFAQQSPKCSQDLVRYWIMGLLTTPHPLYSLLYHTCTHTRLDMQTFFLLIFGTTLPCPEWSAVFRLNSAPLLTSNSIVGMHRWRPFWNSHHVSCIAPSPSKAIPREFIYTCDSRP